MERFAWVGGEGGTGCVECFVVERHLSFFSCVAILEAGDELSCLSRWRSECF
jgi:hypothetical protein